MDYSRDSVIQKQKSIKSTVRRLNSKLWIVVFRMVIIVVVTVAIVCVMAGLGSLNAIIDATPNVEIQTLAQTNGTRSISYFADGTVAQTFAGAEANRILVDISEIPLVVQRCYVALEDERFYEHNGIDVRGIFRAGYSILKERDGLGYGASTITQQLIKNKVFDGGREKNPLDMITRKVQEQYLAIQLETVLSKDKILEFYLNYINLGNGAYGIQMAAQSYFGKDVSELTLSEAAVLAPIALSPTNLNPITHPDRNAERRLACLKNMLTLGYCTEEEFNEAVNDDVYSRVASYNTKQAEVSSTYSYFTDEVIDQVINDLMSRLGYTNEQARNLIYFGGLSIYTTQDPKLQRIVDSYYQDESNFPAFGFTSSTGSCYELTYALSVYKKDGSVVHYQRSDFLDYFKDYDDTDGLYYHEKGGKKGISELFLDIDDMEAKIAEYVEAMVEDGDTYKENKTITPQPQSSFTLIEQATGKVVAVYGGRGSKTTSLSLNRATKTLRQVGSTFKVLASFLPAIDAAGLTLASVQDDSRYFYPGTKKEVINWYTTGFRGLQSIRSGISNSLNVVAVKTLEQIGAPLGFEYLEKLGFSSLVKAQTNSDGKVFTDINLSIALGGLTYGVTNAELTAAYAAIANGGLYNKPIYYTKVLDSDGKVILSNTTEPTQVMKTSTAWLLTDAMHDTTTSGTGGRLRFKNYKMPVAGKTGTASKNNDLWFAGFTPYYTASVWTGYDNNFNQKNKSYQQDLWRNIMEDIHSSCELPYTTFEMPDSIVKATICTKCGNLAVTGLCDEAEGGSCTKVEYFAKGTVPSSKCSCHAKFTMCKTSHKLATDHCPKKRTKTVVLLIKDENYEETTQDTPYICHPEEVCDRHVESNEDTDPDDTDPDDIYDPDIDDIIDDTIDDTNPGDYYPEDVYPDDDIIDDTFPDDLIIEDSFLGE